MDTINKKVLGSFFIIITITIPSDKYVLTLSILASVPPATNLNADPSAERRLSSPSPHGFGRVRFVSKLAEWCENPTKRNKILQKTFDFKKKKNQIRY